MGSEEGFHPHHFSASGTRRSYRSTHHTLFDGRRFALIAGNQHEGQEAVHVSLFRHKDTKSSPTTDVKAPELTDDAQPESNLRSYVKHSPGCQTPG